MRKQTFLAQRQLRASGLRSDLGDRKVVVQLAYNLPHCGGERSRFAVSAQREMHRANLFAFLLPRCVEQWLDLFALAHVFGVGYYADDLDIMLAIDNRDVLAQRIFSGKKLTRESLTNNGDSGSALIILRSESASAHRSCQN